jgi:hypothetical protein
MAISSAVASCFLHANNALTLESRASWRIALARSDPCTRLPTWARARPLTGRQLSGGLPSRSDPALVAPRGRQRGHLRVVNILADCSRVQTHALVAPRGRQRGHLRVVNILADCPRVQTHALVVPRGRQRVHLRVVNILADCPRVQTHAFAFPRGRQRDHSRSIRGLRSLAEWSFVFAGRSERTFAR